MLNVKCFSKFLIQQNYSFDINRKTDEYSICHAPWADYVLWVQSNESTSRCHMRENEYLISYRKLNNEETRVATSVVILFF